MDSTTRLDGRVQICDNFHAIMGRLVRIPQFKASIDVSGRARRDGNDEFHERGRGADSNEISEPNKRTGNVSLPYKKDAHH